MSWSKPALRHKTLIEIALTWPSPSIYRIFNETTRFCGYMFVLSPLVYPQWASSRRQLTTGEAVVCGLREALGVIGIGLRSILRTAVSRWSHCRPRVDLPRSLYLSLDVCSKSARKITFLLPFTSQWLYPMFWDFSSWNLDDIFQLSRVLPLSSICIFISFTSLSRSGAQAYLV
jgi:hypothetical protein